MDLTKDMNPEEGNKGNPNDCTRLSNENKKEQVKLKKSVLSLCRLCGEGEETINHAVSDYKMLAHYIKNTLTFFVLH